MSDRPKVLCVDDELNILRTLQRLFRPSNWEILVATSATSALEMLERESVQVVLSDYRMPDMSGVDLLQQIHQRWPDTVGIILSGHADITAVTRAQEEKLVFRFIPKPWKREELREAVSEGLQLYYRRRPSGAGSHPTCQEKP